MGGAGGSQSFGDAMSKIASQAKAQQLLELRDQRRREIRDRISKVIGFLVVTGLLGAAYYYRAPLQEFVSSKLTTSNQPHIGAGMAAALGGVQADAAKRDSQIDELTASMKTANPVDTLKNLQASAAKRDSQIDEMSAPMKVGSTGESLKSIQANAAKSDQVLNAITR